MRHVTVLLHEAVEALALTKSSIVVDATLGSAGHAEAICGRLGEGGHLIGIDTDASALAQAAHLRERTQAHVTLVHRNFAEIQSILSSLQIEAVDAILADLGWRSEQFVEGKKGLSFMHDEPLLMTLGDPGDYPFTAHDVVNDWKEEDIANVLFAYGEERYSRRIAHAIVYERARAPIASTKALVAVIEAAVPVAYRRGRIHPATRTFQALRIVVNDELSVLEEFIAGATAVLRPGGRLAIITFHSLEDRIVKHTFREYAATGDFALVTKRPIVPTETETHTNPRARSAKLRVITKQAHATV